VTKINFLIERRRQSINRAEQATCDSGQNRKIISFLPQFSKPRKSSRSGQQKERQQTTWIFQFVSQMESVEQRPKWNLNSTKLFSKLKLNELTLN